VASSEEDSDQNMVRKKCAREIEAAAGKQVVIRIHDREGIVEVKKKSCYYCQAGVHQDRDVRNAKGDECELYNQED